ncbi:MAG: C69 family dipeptidase [Anaerolineae bacterium]
MCDTLVATPAVTREGVMLFGKNSDREPNEAQVLEFVPGGEHPAGSRLKCTYIAIPQVKRTWSVVLSRPFWMWGAEMGFNEHGLVIGNEAVFAREPVIKEKTLTGMDLLRLALERAVTAREAVEVITGLVAEHGQGGNGGFRQPLYYHNSFLLADPQDAWVLEVVGRHWAARQVRGMYAISNRLTIETEWDLVSPDLVHHAVERGWCKNRSDFNFARDYSDRLYTRFSNSAARLQCSLKHLQNGELTVHSFFSALRSHEDGGDSAWRPDRGWANSTVCMHAGFGPARHSQTAGSLVSYLHPQHLVHFVTATAAPCTSIFKPVWWDCAAAVSVGAPSGEYDGESLFWQHEKLHRATLLDFDTRLALYAPERNQMEQDFVTGALRRAAASRPEREAWSRHCFQEARQAEARWYERVTAAPVQSQPGWLYRLAWQGFNREAKMPN